MLRLGLLFTLAALAFAAPADAAKLIHDYRFQGNLKDSKGGAALKSLGGGVGNGIYLFGAGQGLKLKKLGVKTKYTVELTFRLDAVSQYRKLLDFKKRKSDNGLYILDGELVFYDFTAADGAIAADEMVVVRLERNKKQKRVRGFINNVLFLDFIDNEKAAVFSSKAFFFVDDTTTEDEESGGAVTRIRIFKGPVTPN